MLRLKPNMAYHEVILLIVDCKRQAELGNAEWQEAQKRRLSTLEIIRQRLQDGLAKRPKEPARVPAGFMDVFRQDE